MPQTPKKPYDPNLWENDPHLLPMTPERQQQIDEGVFIYFVDSGITPEAAYPREGDAEKRERYRAWIEERRRKAAP